MSKLGIGVIGVGTLGRRHAENLRRAIPAAQLIAVADADGGRAKQVASELEIQHHFDNVEDLLESEDINGTLFLDAAIHEFDLARWLMNDEVAEVHSFGGVRGCPELAEFGDVDSAVVNMRFGRGGIGNVECLRKSNYGYDIRTEVVGSRGAFEIGYLRQTAQLVLTSAGASYDTVDHWLVRFADAYLNELRDFVDAVLNEKPVQVDGQEGLRALAVCLAAERSHRESRPVALER